MSTSILQPPPSDPAVLFDLFRGNFATELLTVASAHLNVFGRLAELGPQAFADLGRALGLEARPLQVLLTALQAFGLVQRTGDQYTLTPLARTHLVPGGDHDVSGYLGLASDSPGVREMLERLRTNVPAGAKDKAGAAFIYREGLESAMEIEQSARHLTFALAGRARNVGPVLAQNHPLADARCLLDVGGGSGLYSIAWLQQHTHLRAVVWDRPEVLKVAAELAATHGVAERLECRAGDMFTDEVPAGCDVVLFSNVLHDWDVPQCRELVARTAAALPAGGRLLIHDVFLNDALDGPLPLALYSAALFSLSEGRVYSAGEYREWLTAVGLTLGAVIPTLIHCGVLAARK